MSKDNIKTHTPGPDPRRFVIGCHVSGGVGLKYQCSTKKNGKKKFTGTSESGTHPSSLEVVVLDMYINLHNRKSMLVQWKKWIENSLTPGARDGSSLAAWMRLGKDRPTCISLTCHAYRRTASELDLTALRNGSFMNHNISDRTHATTKSNRRVAVLYILIYIIANHY